MAASATATTKERWIEIPDGMKTPLIASGIFHVVLVIVMITGLPYFKKDVEKMETAVPIEIVPIAEMTTTNRIPLKAPPKPVEELKEKPIQKEKPLPPKSEPVEKPPEPKVEKQPKPEEKKEKPKVVEKPKAKPLVPPPPTEKLEEAKEEVKKDEKKPEEEQQQSFDSLLKNLQESTPEVTEPVPETKTDATPAPAPMAPMAAEMTMDDMAALRKQLSTCWSIQAGARYAEDMAVEIRMIVAPDRRLISASVVDQWRYNQDSYFRAAADSAIRAVNSPQCEVLLLPPDKYDKWKDMIVNFDPRDML